MTKYSETLHIALRLRIKLSLKTFQTHALNVQGSFIILWGSLNVSILQSALQFRTLPITWSRMFKKFMRLTFGEITSSYRRSGHATCTDVSVEGLSAEPVAGVWLRLVLVCKGLDKWKTNIQMCWWRSLRWGLLFWIACCWNVTVAVGTEYSDTSANEWPC